jgi:predicted TIM-barrel fold metal-dependent hydrolase
MRRSTLSHTVLILAAILPATLTACREEPPVVSRVGAAAYDGRFIDAHFHVHPQIGRRGDMSYDMAAAAKSAIAVMDREGIASAIVMPPPFPGDRDGYDVEQLQHAVRQFPDRFAFLGGGGRLNPLIHASADAETVTDAVRADFTSRARSILEAGARGFGELTALHFSMRPQHPFEQVRPDHPLFLLLADIAADAGLPIDLHMEAVPQDMPVPRRILMGGGTNPPEVKANIAAFERLLSHNRRAAVIWAHAGWDNTGQRTPQLMRRLLQAHPNLYMSMKFQQPGRGGASNPLDANRGLRPAWQRLLQDFPDRFLMANDSHIYGDIRRQSHTRGIDAARAFLRQLPEKLARSVGYDNARRLFRLAPSPTGS